MIMNILVNVIWAQTYWLSLDSGVVNTVYGVIPGNNNKLFNSGIHWNWLHVDSLVFYCCSSLDPEYMIRGGIRLGLHLPSNSSLMTGDFPSAYGCQAGTPKVTVELGDNWMMSLGNHHELVDPSLQAPPRQMVDRIR